MRKIAVLMVLVVAGYAQAQPAVKTKEQAELWRAKAKASIEDASLEYDAMVSARFKLAGDLKKLDDELALRKPVMTMVDYDKALKVITVAKTNAFNSGDHLSKAMKALTKATELMKASDNQYGLGLIVASGNKAVDAAIQANAVQGHCDRAFDIIDVGWDRWIIVDNILKKYRTVE